ASLPRRDLVAGHGIHLHIECQQVVATLRAMAVVDLLEEEVAVEALAEQTPLHVRERHDHRVDRSVGAELVQRQHFGMSSLVEGAGARRLPPARSSNRSYADDGAVPAAAPCSYCASICASSSSEPCAIGPVNHLRAERSHQPPTSTNVPTTAIGA